MRIQTTLCEQKRNKELLLLFKRICFIAHTCIGVNGVGLDLMSEDCTVASVGDEQKDDFGSIIFNAGGTAPYGPIHLIPHKCNDGSNEGLFRQLNGAEELLLDNINKFFRTRF